MTGPAKGSGRLPPVAGASQMRRLPLGPAARQAARRYRGNVWVRMRRCGPRQLQCRPQGWAALWRRLAMVGAADCRVPAPR